LRLVGASDDFANSINFQYTTQKVDTILKEHQPEPMPEDIQKELKAIVQRAETSFS
jgi:trimethylamine:corrinoid methyltransferase-like protein